MYVRVSDELRRYGLNIKEDGDGVVEFYHIEEREDGKRYGEVRRLQKDRTRLYEYGIKARNPNMVVKIGINRCMPIDMLPYQNDFKYCYIAILLRCLADQLQMVEPIKCTTRRVGGFIYTSMWCRCVRV